MSEVSPYMAERPRQVTQLVSVPMNCWTLAAEEGSVTTHARFTMILRHKNEAGEWDDSVQPQRAEIEDFPESTDPRTGEVLPAYSLLTDENGQRTRLPAETADHLRLLLFSAVHPDGPLAQAYGVVGLSNQDAGAAILRRLTGQGA
jgi:hypothetical protein